MERLTIEDIKQVIYKLDIDKRPYALLVNPEDAKTFRDKIPDIEEYVKLIEREGVANIQRRAKQWLNISTKTNYWMN